MPMETLVRCKFICMAIVQFRAYYGKLLYKCKFNPVTSGSDENKRFYDATPSGSLEFATIREMPFTIGAEYYVDLIPA